jgi:hypothetical protein
MRFKTPSAHPGLTPLKSGPDQVSGACLNKYFKPARRKYNYLRKDLFTSSENLNQQLYN